MSTNSDTQQSTGTEPGPHAQAQERPPLRRAVHGRMLAGVAAGLAAYLGVDVTIVRIVIAALGVLGVIGSSLAVAGIPLYLAGIPLYLACWLLIPEEGQERSIAGNVLHSGHSGSS